MGMYDTINGEQVKIFYKAYVHISDGFLEGNNVVGYSGGNLTYYDVDSNVPYVTYYYNLGSDFNIIDLHPYDTEEPIVHMIRNGKNIGAIPLFKIKDEELRFNNYDDHGNQFNFNNVTDILNYEKIMEEIKNLRQKEQTSAWREYMEYLRECRDSDIDEKKLEELIYAKNLEKRKADEMRKPLEIERAKYLLGDPMENEYSEFGALISGLKNNIFKSALEDGYEFIVSDERLTFIVAYNKLKNYLDRGDQFLKNYFNFMQMPKTMAEELIDDLIELKEMYEDMCNLKVKKEQIGENYLLNDILNGRYKKYYLEYNVLPFEGFDYDTWKYCKQDYEEKGESIFEKIERKVDKRIEMEFKMNEEER